MILILFFLVMVLQLITYSYVDKKKIRFGRLIILILILILYSFVFPFLLTPNAEDIEDPGVILSIFTASLFVGGGITLLTHFVYVIVKRGEDKMKKM